MWTINKTPILDYRGDKAEPAAGKNVGGMGTPGDDWFDVTQKPYAADHESGDPHGGIGGWSGGKLPVKIDASANGEGLFAMLRDGDKDYFVTGRTVEAVQEQVRQKFGRHKYRWRISKKAEVFSEENEDEC